MTISLISARNRVKQAEAVLGAWFESSRDDYEATLISAIITLIEGVEESIKEADTKLDSLIK
ncbi:hypothetical protein ZK99_002090 [Salmonella enterica subsp. enterica]|uniref:Prophage protein n=1 Tax=Salmonella enterica subsp. enterica serovar Kottbus TaxID=224727 RepID=A0A5J0S462_SALET|nr:hypothetical protein [Salmonella enterica subsp. enterica serovar Newport]EBQ9795164.1 hypothetical protein [Salmonella enterica subsp. enterica serovar Kottbus]EDE8443412.1 hypothetical protein [Salmonella enterica subsp. enterica serovar Pomona]EDJ1502147.1 hypothetical protein [Salmonella enterica]EDN4394340.1 hypothetical protein [Salmonella enterica subsp. enterica]MKM03091.1 hypothetical protein [Salmonella enterica subsp. enterica serovar Isaszeg]